MTPAMPEPIKKKNKKDKKAAAAVADEDDPFAMPIPDGMAPLAPAVGMVLRALAEGGDVGGGGGGNEGGGGGSTTAAQAVGQIAAGATVDPHKGTLKDPYYVRRAPPFRVFASSP